MRNVKTAISIEKSLFAEADDLAKKLKVSRSRLYVLALEDYVRRQHNRELLARINAMCVSEPDPSEQALRRKARHRHRRIVEGEW